MKSHDEIKKGLECRLAAYTDSCTLQCATCPHYIPAYNAKERTEDVIALIRQLQDENTEKDQRIQQLEATVSEKEKVIAELSGKIGRLESKLNEAVNDLHRAVNCPATLVACEFCKNNEVCPHDGTCDAVENDRWQWRGISKEGH